MGGDCNAGAALLECKASLFSGDAGGRKRLLLVLLAGRSSDPVSDVAASIKTAGVKMISVGIGGFYVQSQLAAMAFSSSYILYAASYSGLVDVRGKVSKIVSRGTYFQTP